MLLRSSSSPIPKSCLPAPVLKVPSPAHRTSLDHHPVAAELLVPISKARPVTIPFSISSPTSFSSSSSPSPKRAMARALSESDLSESGIPLKKKGEEEQSKTLARLLSSSGLDGLMVEHAEECCVAEGKGDGRAATLVGGGGCVDGGGRICGGRGRGGGGGGGAGGDNWGNGFGSSDPHKSTEEYYLKMIEANPSNSLVLANYAKFLKEVQGDLVRAKEYCERAIVVNSGDADALSLYADLIWQTSKDAERAETYFDQAVQAAPQDCYVMASYARFLWDAEEEEEEEKESNLTPPPPPPPPFLQGTATTSIAAA